jgi:hypothetical protein
MQTVEIITHLYAALSGLEQLGRKEQAEIDAYFKEQQRGLSGPFFDNPVSTYTYQANQIREIIQNLQRFK